MILAVLTEMHVILALIIILLLFGGKKLPELATITTTYEELELIFSTREGIAEDNPDSSG